MKNNMMNNNRQKNNTVINGNKKLGNNTKFRKLGAKALTVSLALGLMNLSSPSSVSAEGLRDALASAYMNNPDLQAQRAALRATDEGVSRATSGFMPTITGQAQYSQNYSDGLSGTTPIDSDSKSQVYTARVDQSLFSGFQSYNGRREARSLVDAGRALLLSAEQQTLLNAVTAYMDVVRDEAVLRLNTNNVQVLSRQLQASRDRFRVGEITRTDVAQSEARMEGSKATQISAEANLAASRAVYRQVIGNSPGSLDEPPALPVLPSTVDGAISIALDENPQISIAYYNEEAASHAISRSRGTMLPQVGAFASISRTDGSTFQFFNNSTVDQVITNKTVGIQAQWQLYQGGAEYSDVRRAKQVRSQRRLEMMSADRQVRSDVSSTFEQYRASVSTIVSNQSQVRANEIALEGVRQEAAVGSRTTLDVLDAEQELLDARVNLVRAERNRYVAGFQLLLTTGRLNAVSLDLPVELYDPDEYYKDVRWKMLGWGTD